MEADNPLFLEDHGLCRGQDLHFRCRECIASIRQSRQSPIPTDLPTHLALDHGTLRERPDVR